MPTISTTDSHRFVIIGGREKCGTSSLYAYLRALRVFTPSKRKETNYFFSEAPTFNGYLEEFETPDSPAHSFLEASPAYLTCSDVAEPRIRAILPNVRMIFLLRNPVERFLSSFHFNKSKYLLPEDLTLEDYVDECVTFYEDGRPQDVERRWYKDVLGAGLYAERLQPYLEHSAPDDLLVLDFHDVANHPERVIDLVCQREGIKGYDLNKIDFRTRNATFYAKRKPLHRLAMGINSRFETFWHTHPKLKGMLLRVYQGVNATPQQGREIPEELRSRITDFYQDDQERLERLNIITRLTPIENPQPEKASQP